MPESYDLLIYLRESAFICVQCRFLDNINKEVRQRVSIRIIKDEAFYIISVKWGQADAGMRLLEAGAILPLKTKEPIERKTAGPGRKYHNGEAISIRSAP